MKLFDRTIRPLSWLTVDFDRELDVVAVRSLMLALSSHRSLGRIALEATVTRQSVSYRVGATDQHSLQALLEAALPTAAIYPGERSMADHGTAWTIQANTRRRSLETHDPEGASRRLLTALVTGSGRSGTAVIHQLVIDRRLRPMAVPNRLEHLPADTWPQALLAAVTTGQQPIDAEARRALATKQAQPGAEVAVRLLIPNPPSNTAATETTATGSTSPAAYAAALRSLEGPGLRLRLRRDRWRPAVEVRRGRHHVATNADELLSLTGWPYGETSYPGLDRTGARQLRAQGPKAADRVIGTATHPGRHVPLGLPAVDGLRHLHVIGPTGVGKSTMLLNLILQDIEDGRAVVVLDPKGDLVDDVLARVPDAHADRLVVLDPARTESIVGFNPLHTRPEQTELAVDGILHVFAELHADSWGPRSQDILHNCLLTLAGTPQASLYFIPQLLSDPTFRRKVLNTSSAPPGVRAFWRWFDELSEAERASVIAPLLNKLRPFTLRRSLRSLIGQVTPRFDPFTVLTERKVLLVPLRKGLIGSQATNLLGSLIVARLWQLGQSRTAIPPARRHPVFFYLDEFQDYLRLPTDLADVLAQARGLGLGLVLAHQHLGQLKVPMRSAVLANAQSRILFRLGAEDAGLLSRSIPELDAADLTSLGRYEIYAQLLHEGQATPYASARTHEPTQPARDPDALATDLARRWGRPLPEIDSELETSRTASVETPIGRKPRRSPARDGNGRRP